MGLNCKIVYRDGQALALNDNGQISPLYLEALSLYKDEQRALNVWAVSHSEEFQDAFGITPEEAILEDVVTYLDTMSFTDKKMSPSDKVQVNSFMVKNGFESLSDLNGALSKIFKSKGFFQFDEQKMINSGLWKASELPYARTKRKQIQDLLSRIEGELILNDYTVAAETDTKPYRNSTNKTIFGTSEIIDPSEISRAINNLITNFQDAEEFYAKIKELPYDEFVEKFYSNDAFAQQLINRYKKIKKTPVLSFVNNELSADNNETYTTLKNTLLSNVNNISIEADLSYLQGISPQIWNSSQRAIKEILKEVEVEAAKINIDIVGLSNYSNQQDKIIDLLSSLNNLLQRPTESNIQEFAQKKDAFIAPENNQYVTETLHDNLLNLNIVRLDSSKTDNELFAEHGLIKVGDNLYHKVKRGQVSELYDYLYNQVVDGNLNIPIKTEDLTDKPAVLRYIAEYVNARDTGIVSEYQEEISLNQLAFGHLPISQEKEKRSISQLPIISTDVDYLKTEFVSDFYNYVLEEKLNNSELYRDVLSHFAINDRDISLQGTKTPNIDGIKYEREFRDYARLKRDASLKEYVEEADNGVNEDLYALNFPEKVPVFRGEVIVDGDFAVLNSTNRKYVRLNSKNYRQVGRNQKVSVLQEIKTKPDTIYYTTNLNFKTNQKEVDKVMERYPEGLSVQELTYEQKQENLKNARMTEGIPVAKYQIISEGNQLTGEDKTSFEAAKEMETKGKSREDIFKQTRWFKVKGNQWRREIGDLIFNPQIDVDALAQELFDKGEVIVDVTDLFDISEVEANMSSQGMKINLKYKDGEKEEFLGYASKRGDQSTIIVDITGRGIDSINGLLGGRPYRVFGTGVEKTATSLVNHEWQHLSQLEAGRKVGNSTKAIVEFYYRQNADKIGRVTSNQQVLDKLATLYGVKDFVEEIAKPIYLNSIGEREAQEVEARLYDKSKAPSMFEGAIEYDVFDFTKGNVIVDNLGMSYMDVTPTDLKFNQNLIEFIRQKGVQVVTDSEQMQTELEASMPMVEGFLGRGSSTNITVKEDSVTIRQNPDSEKLKTMAGVKGANKFYAKKIREGLKKELGDLYKADYVKSFTAQTYAGTTIVLPQEVKYLMEERSVVLDDITKQAARQTQEEYERIEDIETMHDMGYDVNYLQTPAGNVLGFEKNGIIYLDETQLNDVTTLHELVHVEQMVLDIRAAQGDEIAQQIIAKREEVFNDEAEAAMQFHEGKEINVISVYHGGTVDNISDASKDNPLFVSEDISQAQEYLKERDGKVSTFNINSSKIADEDIAYSIINELKLQSKEEGWDINELNIFELIDSNFSTSLSKEDISKVFTSLENKGYGAIRFTDTNLKTLKQDISNIVVFNPSLVASSSENINPMIIGEKGAEKVDEINNKLDEAKQMTISGVDPLQIEKETGWFNEQGQWKYFSKKTIDKFNIKEGVENKIGEEQSLEDVLVDDILFEIYPELRDTKVVFYEKENGEFGYTTAGGEIFINTKRSFERLNNGKYLGGLLSDGRGVRTRESIVHTIVHETQHLVQRFENFPRGGGLNTIPNEAKKITGEDRPQIGFQLEAINEKLKDETLPQEQKRVLVIAKLILDSKEDSSNAYFAYKMLFGELEAETLEYVKGSIFQGVDVNNITFSEYKNKLLERLDIRPEEQIVVRYQSQLKDTIGLDLSSPLYAQRPSETRQEWKTRLLKEVEAYVVAPATAKKLENLRKKDPSLWQQITEYINQLTDWLKTQIGLTEYKGDIMSLTKEEYIDALGVSILKDEYNVLPTYQQLKDKYNTIAPFKNGEIEIIYQHSEAQHEEVMNKIDECGG